MLTGLLELELVEDHVKVLRLTQLELVRAGDLGVHVASLGASARFDQPVEKDLYFLKTVAVSVSKNQVQMPNI